MSVSVSDLRNVAFIGHPSAGKTALVDALAHAVGAVDRRGSVADGTSVFDTEPEEHEKQHTLTCAALRHPYEGREWTLIDTPGYPDFVSETLGGIFAADLVVGVVSCSSGVTFNLRSKLNAAERLGKGRMIAITHLDGDNADFDATVEALRSTVGETCVPVRVPDQSGSGFSALSRVVTDESSPWRQALMDRVMDACEDEALLERYLETETLSEEQLEAHLPAAIAKGAVIPILPLQPETGLGVADLLTFIGHYGPSPATNPTIEIGGEAVAPDPAGQLTGVVFNVKSDPHVGKVCQARILTGTVKASDALVGARGKESRGEKLGGLFVPAGGKSRRTVESAIAGEIVSFSKVEGLEVGEGFTAVGHDAPEVRFAVLPEPTVSLAVEPKSRADEQKIGAALTKLAAEDPTLRIDHDSVTNELVVRGTSDLHLQVMEARLRRRFGVEIETALPRIAYQETITKPAESHYRHKKQSGGRGQFGECYLRLRPGEPGSGITFVDKIVGGSIPRNLIPAIDKGVREVASKGVLTRSRVVDVEVEVYDGKFHAVDSDEASFKMAGGRAFKEGFISAGPVLLEPVMAVDIHVPSDDAGAIFSDITSQRRGQVIDQSSEEDGAITVIKAHVPLSTMQTYHRDLKSQTAGEGTYSMTFERYSAVPANEQQRIVTQSGLHDDDER